jgi:hypothetical protein
MVLDFLIDISEQAPGVPSLIREFIDEFGLTNSENWESFGSYMTQLKDARFKYKKELYFTMLFWGIWILVRKITKSLVVFFTISISALALSTWYIAVDPNLDAFGFVTSTLYNGGKRR